MGQVMQKVTGGRGDAAKNVKPVKEIDNLIDEYIKEAYGDDFPETRKEWKKTEFYHAIYGAFEKISEKSGAIQFKLPKSEVLEKAFEKAHPAGSNKSLTKDEFRKIIGEVVTLNSFYVGKGAQDILLYIFGIPIAALLAKRMIPGPTANISEDVFIPVVTSGTVYFLAKTNRL